MYALSLTTYRLVRKASSSKLSSLSRYSYKDMMHNGVRITTTSSFKKSFLDPASRERYMQSRYYAIGDKKSLEDVTAGKYSLNCLVEDIKSVLKTVKLSELKSAPQPAFFLGAISLVPFVVPVVSSLLFGYSPFMMSAQLAYGATVSSFLGGAKFGYAIPENSPHPPTWENLTMAVIPQGIAWLGLLAPLPLGFLLVSCALAAGTLVDLLTACYPPWFQAMRLGFTVPAIALLLLSALISLIH